MIGGIANITPVKPPSKKVIKNPITHNIGVSKDSEPRHIVPIQLKNLTPVGTAINIVVKAKKGSETAPVTYIWCAQTATDKPEIAIVAKTNPL